MIIDRNNSTLFGIAPMRATLPAAGVVLTALFVAMRPAATEGLDVLARSAFWALHIGIGLAGIYVASLVVRQSVFRRWPTALSVLVTGLIGAFIVAPLYLVVEAFMPVPAAQIPDDALDHFAARGPGQAVIVEYLEVVPAFVSAWFAINLPLLLRRGDDESEPSDGDDDPSGRRASAGEAEDVDDACRMFLDSLPRAVGRDIVSVSSDLHYLHVQTVNGRAMVLGNLRDVVQAFGDDGLLVHKSHWVCSRHVSRYTVAGQRAFCEMSSGAKVPVSRRKRKEVKAMFGAANAVRLASVQ